MRSFSAEIERLESAVAHGAPHRGDFTGSSERPVIRVLDEVLTDPVAYRDQALAAGFGDVTIGPITFHGIAAVPQDAFGPTLSAVVGMPLGVTFFRQSPAGQEEPNYIHTDRDMGEWTGILYLTPHPSPLDGTAFWKHRPTGSYQSASDAPEEFMAEWQAWRDDDQWKRWALIPAEFNRAIIFPAAAYHSRAIRENYGSGDLARLTQVAFARRESVCR